MERKTYNQPKNPKITISELGDESYFIGGTKKWRLEWATIDGKTFKKGVKVSYEDPDDGQVFSGKIDWIILIEDGSVEVSIDAPIGRLSLEDLVLI